MNIPYIIISTIIVFIVSVTTSIIYRRYKDKQYIKNKIKNPPKTMSAFEIQKTYGRSPVFLCDQKCPCSSIKYPSNCAYKGCGFDCFMTNDPNHRVDCLVADDETGRLIPIKLKEEPNEIL